MIAKKNGKGLDRNNKGNETNWRSERKAIGNQFGNKNEIGVTKDFIPTK